MEEEHNTHIVEERNIGLKKALVEKGGGHLEERQSFVEPLKKRLLRLTAVRKVQEVELGEAVSKEDKSRRGRLEESWGVTMHEVVVDSEASSNPPSGVTGIQRLECVDEPNTARITTMTITPTLLKYLVVMKAPQMLMRAMDLRGKRGAFWRKSNSQNFLPAERPGRRKMIGCSQKMRCS